MAEEIKKEYTNGELTIVWKPQKCIHSGVCFRTLPDVYHPSEKPWIKIENATTEALKTQLDACPSGALSYYMNTEKKEESIIPETKIDVLPNGPLVVFGTLKVTRPDGQSDTKTNRTTFCRCGASANKPYCDGSHKKIEFRG